MMDLATFCFRATAQRVALVLTAAALGYRIDTVIIALQVGDPSPLLAFPFGAILPAVLLIVLVAMPPTEREKAC